MLGAVIGDVIGSVYEFNNTKDYNFRLFSKESNYTDDTILTMAVADWAMNDPKLTHVELEKYIVAFAKQYPHPVGEYGGTFKMWLFHPEALIDYRTGQPALGRCPYNSWGNGSAMRVSAIGWLYESLEETERVAGISASITHNHPEGIKGAQAVAAAVFMARNGATRRDIREYIEQHFGYDLSDSWTHLHATYDWDSSCQGTVPQAVIAFLESKDFEDAIRKAVSLGGDSDTLACITGAIAEAYYKAIPDAIVCKVMGLLPVKMKKVMEQFGQTFYADCFDKYVARHLRTRVYTPNHIQSLQPGEVFVFGSNLAGAHGGGAARLAYERFGAVWGVGVGMTGQCYAIPTMHGGVEAIRPYVDDFIAYAQSHPEYKFLVTKIGCGIAGFKEEEIAPLFTKALKLANVILPESFCKILFS